MTKKSCIYLQIVSFETVVSLWNELRDLADWTTKQQQLHFWSYEKHPAFFIIMKLPSLPIFLESNLTNGPLLPVVKNKQLLLTRVFRNKRPVVSLPAFPHQLKRTLSLFLCDHWKQKTHSLLYNHPQHTYTWTENLLNSHVNSFSNMSFSITSNHRNIDLLAANRKFHFKM